MMNKSILYTIEVFRLDCSVTTPYARSFRRRFFAFHYTVNHPHTNIILPSFSIPLVLKCAAKNLKICLQTKL